MGHTITSPCPVAGLPTARDANQRGHIMLDTVVWSLRRRLILICGFGIGSTLALGYIAMYWAETVEDRQIVDARLEQLGSAVLFLVDNGLVDRSSDPLLGAAPLKTRPAATMLYRYQVWSKDGVLLLRSHEAPAERPIVDLTHLGFETVRIGGEDYRAFSLPTKDNGVIQLAECLNEASVQVSAITAYYAGFLLLPLGLVFCVCWLLTRRALRSIDSLAEELRRRNPLDVTQLVVKRPPHELLPILNALDSLFTRVGHAISVERTFTSVAAHEMRTPLAGLRAQAQIASTAQSEEESRQALRSIMHGVDRAAHMLDQLLDLARIEGLSKDAELLFRPVQLVDAFNDVMRDLGAKASLKRISVGTRFDAPEIYCLGFGLHLILRNLIANAILYCPDGTRIDVGSSREGADVVLTVDDSGVGIPARERDRAFERFNRLGQNKADGVGLGLSIVLLIVEHHGARIQLLDAPIGGLRVRLSFPQQAAQRAFPARLTQAAT